MMIGWGCGGDLECQVWFVWVGLEILATDRRSRALYNESALGRK